MQLRRRDFLTAMVSFGALLDADGADAALARGLTLVELATASLARVVATPLESHCEWATFGPSRMIVTDTRVRIEEHLLREPATHRELFVRTLGGHLGNLGERVDGQAALVRGEPCVLFLTLARDARVFVTGAAQGHYRLNTSPNNLPRLAPSPQLPRLLEPASSAVRRLRGRTIAEARDLLRAALR